MISNNDEIAHINLVKADGYKLLSKYAKISTLKDLTWGLGPIKTPLSAFGHLDVRRIIAMISDSKERMDFNTYFKKRGSYFRPEKSNEVREIQQ